MKKLVITGDEHSGWKDIAALIGAEGDNTAAVWADAALINELESLRKNEPQLRFLLVYSSPEHMLARAMEAEADLLDNVEQRLADWEKSTLAVVNFFQQNRDVAALVNANTLYEQGGELLGLCQQLADITLPATGSDVAVTEEAQEDGTEGDTQTSKTQPPFALMANLALLIPQRERLYQLYDNLQSSASLPGVDLDYAGSPLERGRELALSALEEYRAGLQQVGVQQVQEKQDQEMQEQAALQQAEERLVKAELEEKLSAAEQENELALLQLHQLQEELEHYFLAYKNAKEQLTLSEQEKRQAQQYRQHLQHQLARKPQQLARAASCTVLGVYDAEGYHDVSLCLHDFSYAGDKHLQQLSCKLVQVGDSVGLEIRQKDNADSADQLTWPADMQDDHGPYLLYLPSPGEEQQERQRRLRNELLTRDRQLLSAAAFAIADCFMRAEVDTELLSTEQQTLWRCNAEALARQIRNENPYLSADEVSLKEQFNSDSYHHLWLECSNMQLADRVFPKFGFKLFSADGEQGLEFRDLDDGLPPFEAWPPQSEDEYGHIAKVWFKPNAKTGATHLLSSDAMSEADQAQLKALFVALPAALQRLQDTAVAGSQWQQITAMAQNPVVWGNAPRLSWKRKLGRLLRRR